MSGVVSSKSSQASPFLFGSCPVITCRAHRLHQISCNNPSQHPFMIKLNLPARCLVLGLHLYLTGMEIFPIFSSQVWVQNQLLYKFTSHILGWFTFIRTQHRMITKNYASATLITQENALQSVGSKLDCNLNWASRATKLGK